MKLTHMLAKLLVLIFAIGITNSGYAQDTATWALMANQFVTPVGNITATSQSLSGLVINNYLSSSGGQRVKPNTPDGSWPIDTGRNADRYLQYTVMPAGTDNMVVTRIYLPLSFNSSGTGRAAVSWSTDGINFTDLSSGMALTSGAVPSETILTGLNIPVANGQTFYLRVHPWSITAGIRYLVSKNIRIASVPKSSSTAIWALTSNQNAVTASDMSATSQTLAGLKFNNFLSSNGGERVKNNLPDTLWPAEIGPNSDRYIQYETSPAINKNMTVTKVSMALSFNSSTGGHARITWSTDGTNFTTLIADTNLVAGTTPATIDISGLHIPVPEGGKFYLRISPWSPVAISTIKYVVSKDVVITSLTTNADQLAFPGAEGAGRNAKGGREGSVYYVTTLADSGPGSLRDAVSQSNRTVLFTVSGTIQLNTPIVVTKDYITIAGQTAPGDGICVSQQYFGIRGSNIIIRYMRFRLGSMDSASADALSGGYATKGPATVSNVIIDHCSVSWSVDEAASFYGIGNFTFQWCITSESLYNSVHIKEHAHGYGGLWGGQTTTYHHNLVATHSSRNPRLTGAANSLLPELEYVDYRNNVVYNWGVINSTYGGAGGHYNMVNNYYKPGPATDTSMTSSRTNKRNRILGYLSSERSQTDTNRYFSGGKFYIDGNYVEGFPDVTADNWTKGVQPNSALDTSYTTDSMITAAKMSVAFDLPYVHTQSAMEAYASIADSAGALLPRRDTVDRRIIRETLTGTATYQDTSYYNEFAYKGVTNPTGIIDKQSTVGGWPTLSSTAAPIDSDSDGMPNWWEAKINNNDADSIGVPANTYGSDGYTMLEEYLNAIESPDKQTVFSSLMGAIVGNDSVQLTWRINWAKDLFTYGVLRSTDGVNFTQISSSVSGINKTKYIFHDTSAPAENLYYKIASYRTSGGGDTVYSEVVVLNNFLVTRLHVVESKFDTAINCLAVFPNQAAGIMDVNHNKANLGDVLSVYNTAGKLIKTFTVKEGNVRIAINIVQ